MKTKPHGTWGDILVLAVPSVAFGIWQHSPCAGVVAFFAFAFLSDICDAIRTSKP